MIFGLRKGQTVIEYIFLIGIVVLVMFYMGPAFKRGIQVLVKSSADQIGIQNNSDQLVIKPSTERPPYDWDLSDRSDGGYLVASNTASSANILNNRTDRLYVTNTVFHEAQETMTNSVTNLGVSNE